MSFPTEVDVRCVTFDNSNSNIATKVRLESKPTGASSWQVVAVGENLVQGKNVVRAESSDPPSPLPPAGPTDSPSRAAPAWRLFTEKRFVKTGWSWGVDNIWFHSSADCSDESRIPYPYDATAFVSGSAGDHYGPEGAFGDRAGHWGGRYEESSKNFWIGMSFPTKVDVRCVTFDNSNSNIATKVRLESKPTGASSWQVVAVGENLVQGKNVVRAESSDPLSLPPTKVVPKEAMEDAKESTKLALAALESNNPDLAAERLQQALAALEQ